MRIEFRIEGELKWECLTLNRVAFINTPYQWKKKKINDGGNFDREQTENLLKNMKKDINKFNNNALWHL